MWVLAAGSGCALVRQQQAHQRVERGEQLLTEDDLQAASLAFQEAAELDPQLAVAHSRLGVIYERMGEYERALAAFSSGTVTS